MTLKLHDLENIYVWLSRLPNIPAQEAKEFVECVGRLEATIQSVKDAAAKAPGIPTVPPVKPVASSDDTKPTPKIKEAINTILRESKKQKDAAAKKASRRSTGR